ncbi:MAG TPA: hypothetical protein VF242_07680, partial [Nitrososphaeraceae archaeon]
NSSPCSAHLGAHYSSIYNITNEYKRMFPLGIKSKVKITVENNKFYNIIKMQMPLLFKSVL